MILSILAAVTCALTQAVLIKPNNVLAQHEGYCPCDTDGPCNLWAVPDCCNFDIYPFEDPPLHECIVEVETGCAHSNMDFEKIDVNYGKRPYSLISFGTGDDQFPEIWGCDFESGLPQCHGCDFQRNGASIYNPFELMDCSAPSSVSGCLSAVANLDQECFCDPNLGGRL